MEYYILAILSVVCLLVGIYIGHTFAFRVIKEMINQGSLSIDRVGKVSENKPIEVDLRPEVEEMPLSSEDNINHDGVGIVQRPTSEELARFAEPQAVKDAKAAVAETLRNTPEIDSPTG